MRIDLKLIGKKHHCSNMKKQCVWQGETENTQHSQLISLTSQKYILPPVISFPTLIIIGFSVDSP